MEDAMKTYLGGIPYATYWHFFGQWSANSQYGYTLEWFNTEEEAIAYSTAYYAARPQLLDQWD
jgi:hypothetical protein